MNLAENKVYKMDCLEGLKHLKEKSVNLIIADKPYFEVKGTFDFIWKSHEDYLKDVEKWAKAFKRVLADNGTLFVYGHAKKRAYEQVIFDKYFNLENSLVWEKSDCQTRKGTELFRCFAPVTERILMYSNEVNETGLDNILKLPAFYGIMDYFKKEREKIGWNYKQCDDFLGIKASYCYWDKPTTHAFRIPEKKHYLKLQETGFWSKEYEELRKEYEELRRPFNNSNKLTDVLKFSQQVNITKNFNHPTKKPNTLTRALILTCSRPNDLVLVPFAGSGTECEMAIKERRRFIGFDIEQKYVDMSNDRCKPYLRNKQVSIFDVLSNAA